jgi:preprotein translocase subunit Sss1
MSSNHTPDKKTWMRIVVLALAGIMILGAIILPFI